MFTSMRNVVHRIKLILQPALEKWRADKALTPLEAKSNFDMTNLDWSSLSSTPLRDRWFDPTKQRGLWGFNVPRNAQTEKEAHDCMVPSNFMKAGTYLGGGRKQYVARTNYLGPGKRDHKEPGNEFHVCSLRPHFKGYADYDFKQLEIIAWFEKMAETRCALAAKASQAGGSRANSSATIAPSQPTCTAFDVDRVSRGPPGVSIFDGDEKVIGNPADTLKPRGKLSSIINAKGTPEHAREGQSLPAFHMPNQCSIEEFVVSNLDVVVPSGDIDRHCSAAPPIEATRLRKKQKIALDYVTVVKYNEE